MSTNLSDELRNRRIDPSSNMNQMKLTPKSRVIKVINAKLNKQSNYRNRRISDLIHIKFNTKT